MEVTFWGVRGSIPAPGPEFNRYGGNTACVALHSDSGALVILDAGTGITPLGRQLMDQTPFGRGQGQTALLLTHTHWDHIQGFPFFTPLFIPGNHFAIHGPAPTPAKLQQLVEGQLNPHFSPLHGLDTMASAMSFVPVEPGNTLAVADLTLTAARNPHGRSQALAYRLEQGGRAVVYAPDVGYPEGQPTPPASLALYQGADLLIHDTTYTPEDQQTRRSRGQSSIAEAAAVAARCGVRRLAMFHYDQDYTDDQVDALQDRCRAALDAEPGGAQVELVAAAEGQTLTV